MLDTVMSRGQLAKLLCFWHTLYFAALWGSKIGVGIRPHLSTGQTHLLQWKAGKARAGATSSPCRTCP